MVCVALAEEPPVIVLSIAPKPVLDTSVSEAPDGGSIFELHFWRERANGIAVGTRRVDVERLLPEYTVPRSVTGRLALSDGLSISILSAPSAHPDYFLHMGIRSGLHQIEMYSVTRNIVVTVHYDLQGVASGVVGVSPGNRLLDPVTVEFHPADPPLRIELLATSPATILFDRPIYLFGAPDSTKPIPASALPGVHIESTPFDPNNKSVNFPIGDQF